MRKLIWSIALVLAAGLSASGQSCGWRDTLAITNNSSTTLSLDITDYFNNDLSDPLQGLCGVEINFAHQFVDNLEIRLTSPAGQTINLIGPNTDAQFEFTFFARWRIQFLPCSENPVPDFPSADQWNNNQINNFINGGLYTGSYHPFIGCLENFNTGPVNGTWTFSITNNPSNYGGAITAVRLYFCDSRGVDCCFAEPGTLAPSELLACQNDTSLLLNPQLTFPSISSDTPEYGYTFLLAQDGTYLDTTAIPDLRAFPPGNYEVCGLAYRRSDFDSIPLPDGLLTLDSIRSNLTSFTPWACATLTDTCLQVIIVAPPDTSFLNLSRCEGELVQVGDSIYTQSGIYTNTLRSYAGCDSIVRLDLSITPIPRLDFDVVICEGDTFRVGNQAYTLSGLYTDTLSTVNLGCDSIVRLQLSVLSPVFSDSLAVICAGENFVFHDSTFSQPGLYQVPLLSTQGCDSIVRIDLRVLDPQVLILPPDTLNCYQNQVLLSGTASPPTGQFSYRWLNLAGNTLQAGAQLSVGSPGSYVLEATQTLASRSCSTRDTTTVIEGRNYPSALAASPLSLSCQTPIVTLDGTGSSTGPNIRYFWSSTNGSLLPPINQPSSRADSAGDYRLVVTDIVSGCRDTAWVQVNVETTPPIADIGTGFSLTCAVSIDTLDGSNSSSGPNFNYLWAGPCVRPIAGDDTRIEADCPGWYFLLVEDTSNGCTAVDSVLVSLDQTPPIAAVDTILPLNCLRSESLLDGTPSQPVGGLQFVWQGAGLTGLPNSAQTTANVAGSYTLEVIRTDNFCRDTLVLTLPIDTLPPVADAGSPATINCLFPSALLGGSATSQGSRFIYTWSDSNGPTGAPSDTLRVSVAGQYQLVVQDTLNGCTAQSFVLVSSDINPPPVQVGPDQALACASASVTLSGDESLFTGPVSLSWNGPCLLGPTDAWSVISDCPGIYSLTVTRLDNGCSRSDTLVISLLNDATVAVLPDTATLSCDTGVTILNTQGSSQGIVRWFLDAQQIGLPFPNPEVNQPGLYTLIIDNFDGSCSDTAQVLVVVGCSVEALALAPDTLSCTQQSVQIDGRASTAGPAITYQWLPPAPGCLISAPDNLLAEVVCGGDYRLVVTQTIVGITDTFVLNVAIDTLSPLSVAGPGDTITCSQSLAFLDGSASAQGANISYQWTNSLNEVLSTVPLLSTDEPDVYILEVFDASNGCRGVSQTTVRRDDNVPIIAFGSDVFPCLSDTFSLQAFVSPPLGSYLYQWTGPSIRSGANELSALIDSLGEYTFFVLDPLTGCADTATVLVREQICVPCLSLSALDTLNCINTTADIRVDFCLDCVGCTLQWSDINGPIAGANTLNLTVSEPGDYFLLATDTLGFSSVLTASVVSLTNLPVADAGPDRVLNCDSLQVNIGGPLTETGADLLYLWEAFGGTPILGANSAVATVAQADTFRLQLSSTLSGCISFDTVVVRIDTLRPVAEAGPDIQLACQQTFVALDGQGSSTGQLSYTWAGPAANCLTGQNTLNPVASCAGLYTLLVRNNNNGCEATDTSRVLPVPNLPPLPVLADTSLNCLNTTVNLVAPDPGVGLLSRWCPLDADGNVVAAGCVNGLSYTATQPGSYQYSMTDTLSGCSQSRAVLVSQQVQLPNAQAGPDTNLSCTQDSILLQALAGPYNFSWSEPTGLFISAPNSASTYVYAPGMYILQVSDPINGCFALDSVLVGLNNDAPVANAGPDTLLNCYIDRIRLQGQAQTGSGQNTWLWQTSDGLILEGADTPTPLIGRAGLYILQLTDAVNGCSRTDSLVVSANLSPPTALVSGLDSLQLNCRVDTLLLDGSSSLAVLGQGLNYQWVASSPARVFPTANEPTTFTDRPGLYRLIVTDVGNGCKDTLSFNLMLDRVPPQLSIDDPLPLDCIRRQTSLVGRGDADLAYAWQNTMGEVLSTEDSLVVEEAGLYTLVVTDLVTGCTNSAQVQVNADQEAPQATVAEPAQLGCNRTRVRLDGSSSSRGASFVYAWASTAGELIGPIDSLVAEAGSAGTYWLLVRNTRNGCTAADTVQVSVIAEAIRGLELAIFPPDCFGEPLGGIAVESVTGGVAPFVYAIADEAFSPSPFFEDIPVGSYNIRVRDSQGCLWEEIATILAPSQLLIDLGPDLSLRLGDSARLEAIINLPAYDTLIWRSLGPIPSAGQPVQVVKPTETVYYVATVFDEKGCSASDTVLIRVEEALDVFIPTIFSPNGDNTNDLFTIYAGGQLSQINSLRIFDRWGNLVFRRDNFAPNDPNLGWDGRFEGRPMNAAVFVYYLEVTDVNGKVRTIKGDVVLMR